MTWNLKLLNNCLETVENFSDISNIRRNSFVNPIFLSQQGKLTQISETGQNTLCFLYLFVPLRNLGQFGNRPSTETKDTAFFHGAAMSVTILLDLFNSLELSSSRVSSSTLTRWAYPKKARFTCEGFFLYAILKTIVQFKWQSSKCQSNCFEAETY